MARQPGDTPAPVFSFLGRASEHPQQIDCLITQTNERTHEIIRAATDRSPMFTGVIEGVGPRYCPSVEDKVVRFADKASHQIFVEPEGLEHARGLPERHLHQPAVRRAVRVRAHHPRVRERAPHAARLRHRVRLLRSARPARIARDEVHRRACTSPARSTAPPAMKRPRPRAWSPASTPRSQVKGREAWVPKRSEGLPRRARRRPGHARHARAVPHVHEPRRASPAAARGQRRPAPDPASGASWGSWTTSAGRSSRAKQAAVGRAKSRGSTRTRVHPAERAGRVAAARCSKAPLGRDSSALRTAARPGGRLRRRCCEVVGAPAGDDGPRLRYDERLAGADARAGRGAREVRRLHRAAAGRDRASAAQRGDCAAGGSRLREPSRAFRTKCARSSRKFSPARWARPRACRA